MSFEQTKNSELIKRNLETGYRDSKFFFSNILYIIQNLDITRCSNNKLRT